PLLPPPSPLIPYTTLFRSPTVENYASWLKATLLSLFEHRTEVVILSQRVLLLIKDAIVNRHMAVAISPEQSNQVDATDYLVMLRSESTRLNSSHRTISYAV